MTLIIPHQSSHESESACSNLMTIHEVARALRWNDMTVRRHIKDGAIPASAVVQLPCAGTRRTYRLKRAWLLAVLAGEATHEEPKRPPIVAS